MRDVAFIVFPGFQIQDLSGPLAVFEVAGNCVPEIPYRCHVVSSSGGNVASSSGLAVVTGTIREEAYDTFIVVGGSLPLSASDIAAVTNLIVHAASNTTRRIASVCTGAFLLASTGLLDDKRATTHWKHTAQLQRQFPRIRVERDPIFTKDGRIWTSAGITAGIDLALAMIEEDLGSAVSTATARTLVVYHRRPGGQSQFSALGDMEPESDRIRDVLTYMREHLSETLSTERLAAVACLSIRQFGRAFLAETGETPAKAVERLRVEVAKPRVERGIEPIEVIARAVGFADPERMRRAFIRVIGHPPQSIRRMASLEATSTAKY
ncbi:GlxA family transcriptional regulator [Paraburkholderia caribensis]|uniref:GlxA family transcriptional regulator n=1 Tax=Paraburkholderia caribensis TaxID=75105 RepID=UPI003AAA4DB9